MIMALLVLKTRCKEFYEKNYRIVRSVLKIVISMILYSIILYQLPFSKELREYGIPLSVILALVSGFVPDSVIIFFAAMLAVLEISSVSYLLAACFLFVLLIYFLLFGRYAKSPFDSGTLAAECCICCADRSRIVFESGDDSGMPGRGIYKIYSACG